MSANFCDENPDQGITNEHCFHPVSRRQLPLKRGEPKTRRIVVHVLQCCWCGDKTQEQRVEPIHHGKKARVMR